MALTKQDLEDIEWGRSIGKRYLTDLKTGNEKRCSAIRESFIESVKSSLQELDRAAAAEDMQAVDGVLEELDDYELLLGEFQAAALIEWQDNYAHFLDELYWTLESELQTESVLYLKQAWKRYRRHWPDSIQSDLKELYAHHATLMVERMLGYEENRNRPMFLSGTLNTTDIPGPWRYRLVMGHAADRAVRVHFLEKQYRATIKRLEEAEDPGLMSTIWSIAGWSSFTDFAVDVGLFVVTGGGAAVVKYTKRLTKAARALRKLGSARKLKRLLKVYEDEYKKIEQARKRVRARLKARGASRELNRLSSYGSEILDRVWSLTVDYARSKEASEELVKALDLANKYAASAAAKEMARRILEGEAYEPDGKRVAGSMTSNVFKDLIKEQMKAYNIFGSTVETAKDKLLKQLVIGSTRARVRYFARWFSLLIVREYTALFLEHRTRKRSWNTQVAETLFIKSCINAFEGALTEELGIPKNLTGSAIRAFSKLAKGIYTEIVVAAVYQWQYS